MSEFYLYEDSRAHCVRQIFAKHDIHLVRTKIEGSKFETDGDISHGEFRYVLASVENEFGDPGLDPFLQAMLQYVESTRKQAPAMQGSVLPCLIVVFIGAYHIGCAVSSQRKTTGPHMGFAGAAWNVRPVGKVLSALLPFHVHYSEIEMRRMISRHLGAFKKAIHSLEGYYRSNPSVSRASHQPSSYSQIFPYQTHFTSLADSTTQHFEYVSQPIADKLLFFGKLSDGHDVCIKFARRYSHEAHSFCSSMGAAPELLGFEMLAGGWYMVVMDLIGEDYVEFHQSSCKPDILDELRDILSRLHQAGFVHGDIRDTNVMVSKSSEPRFMLVKFDWAGKIGEVQYPMVDKMRKELWRPDGACVGNLITADHDIQMLEHLL
jgi:hypothetical protein